jgi:hypothetical protein
MRIFRKIKAVEELRGGVAALRRTSGSEDLRRYCGKGAFPYSYLMSTISYSLNPAGTLARTVSSSL